MAGHNKWKQIKHKKAIIDQKRGKAFSKLLRAISVAAKEERNPDFNLRLKSAIEQARGANVPKENIEKALEGASKEESLQEVLLEGYAEEGVALLIKIITDNKNRSVNEIRHILSESGGKIAKPGSVLWLFNKEENQEYSPSFRQEIKKETFEKTLEKLEENDDVQQIFHNANI